MLVPPTLPSMLLGRLISSMSYAISHEPLEGYNREYHDGAWHAKLSHL